MAAPHMLRDESESVGLLIVGHGTRDPLGRAEFKILDGLVKNQLGLVEGRIPVYPGIGQWRLSDDRTVGQIHHARALGADGFTIFNLSRSSAESAR